MSESQHRLDASDAAAWRTWLRDIGALARRMRETVGLSQEQLGRLAKVSQGAVSRFEQGRGLSTPWVVAVRIRVVLAARLRNLGPDVLTDDVRRFVEATEHYGLPSELSKPPALAELSAAITPDVGLEQALRTYARLPAERRRTFAFVVNALADALASADS
jgi:transcriptional regulator with XRE-family HTH domain